MMVMMMIMIIINNDMLITTNAEKHQIIVFKMRNLRSSKLQAAHRVMAAMGGSEEFTRRIQSRLSLVLSDQEVI